MNIHKITNFVIIALVITAVYQTGMLWLEDAASHNFFYTVFGPLNHERVQHTGEGKLLVPGRFAIGSGNRKFSVFYADDENSSQMIERANDVLSEIISDGTPKEETKGTDWEDILMSKCIVFQYDYMIPLEEYLSTGKMRKVQPVRSFDCLVIRPRKGGGEDSAVYFVNSETGESVSIMMESSKFAPSLYGVLDTAESNLSYVSTGQSGFKIFRQNVFVPQWKEALPYSTLQRVNPFEKDGVINRVALENSVDGFFKNFAADWNTKDENGVFTFSDENVVVKYHPEGILEYYGYGIYEKEKRGSTAEGYQICRNFMDNDKSLNTGVYLSDVHVRSNETIFYFDYTVNDFPVVLSEDLRRKIAAEHAIEIIVRNNRVKKYRRYACNFISEPEQNAVVNIEFIKALNQCILEYQQKEKKGVVTEVENMKLGYLVDNFGSVRLKWFTELYDHIYVGNTESIPAAVIKPLEP